MKTGIPGKTLLGFNLTNNTRRRFTMNSSRCVRDYINDRLETKAANIQIFLTSNTT